VHVVVKILHCFTCRIAALPVNQNIMEAEMTSQRLAAATRSARLRAVTVRSGNLIGNLQNASLQFDVAARDASLRAALLTGIEEIAGRVAHSDAARVSNNPSEIEWIADAAWHLGRATAKCTTTSTSKVRQTTNEHTAGFLASSIELLAALPVTEERKLRIECLRWEVPLRRAVRNTLSSLLQNAESVTLLGATNVDALTKLAIHECDGQWSSSTHNLFPTPVRRRAVELFLVGQQLGASSLKAAVSSAFVGPDGLWVSIVMPYLVLWNDTRCTVGVASGA